jgi:excisionase family DNA binding protein
MLLTSKEVRKALGMGVTAFERVLRRGELPVVRVDRLRRFRPEAVAEWIRAHETGGDRR